MSQPEVVHLQGAGRARLCAQGKESQHSGARSHFSFPPNPWLRTVTSLCDPLESDLPFLHLHFRFDHTEDYRTFWKGLLLSSRPETRVWRTENSGKATRSCWLRGGSTWIARGNIFFLRFPYLLCAPGSTYAQQIGLAGWHVVDDWALKKSLPLTQRLCLL